MRLFFSGRGVFGRDDYIGGRRNDFGHRGNGRIENWYDKRTYIASRRSDMRNKCPKLYIGQELLSWSVCLCGPCIRGTCSFRFRHVLISDEEFEKYKIFMQFQATQITQFSSIVTLAQSVNSTKCFTS